MQAVAIAIGLAAPTAAGFAIGSFLLGLPFTAITYFALQEVRRLRPTHVAATTGLVTALWSIGQTAGPPMVAVLLRRSGDVGAAFTLSLVIAAAALARRRAASSSRRRASGRGRGALRPPGHVACPNGAPTSPPWPTPPRSKPCPRRDDDGAWLAVIEATQGTRHKLKYEAEWRAFVLSGVLPLGLSFPYDFGFLPSTLGDDGDPLDVLVLADEAMPPGTVVPCRLVGVIEAEQQDEGAAAERNDRLLAVATSSHRYGECRELDDIAAGVLDEIEPFFVVYNASKGGRFKPLARRGAAARRAWSRTASAAARASAERHVAPPSRRPPRDNGDADESPKDALGQTLDEARMVLPGVQALFGFQLIAVFNAGFTSALSECEQTLHLAAIVLVAIAIALVMTPAAYHRQVDPRRATPAFIRLASRFVSAAMLPLAAGLALDLHLVSRVITRSERVGATIGALAFAMFVGLWFAFPRWRKSHPQRDEH